MNYVFFYLLIVSVSYGILIVSYKKKTAKALKIHVGSIDFSLSKENKMTFLSCLLIAGLFTIYNIYVTSSSGILGSDRQNYMANFLEYRASSSAGLEFIMFLARQLGGDFYTFLYCTSFICVFVVLLACRSSKEYKPEVLLLLFLSQYVLLTFTGLKQAYAVAVSSILFVLQFSDDSIKKRIGSWICIVLAITFHPAGIILVPLYLILNISLTKTKIFIYIFLCVFIGIFFEAVLSISSRILSPIVPSVANKIISYLTDNQSAVAEGGSLFTFIKGVPFYIISIVGIYYRERIRKKWAKYDQYLVVSLTCSFFYLLSIYNVWMMRAIYFLMLPTFIFLVKIVKNIPKREKAVLLFGVAGMLLITTSRFILLVFNNWGGF